MFVHMHTHTHNARAIYMIHDQCTFTFICSLLFIIDGVRESASSIWNPTINLNVYTDIRDVCGGGRTSDVTGITADWSIPHRGCGRWSEGGVRAVVMETGIWTRDVEENLLLAVVRQAMWLVMWLLLLEARVCVLIRSLCYMYMCMTLWKRKQDIVLCNWLQIKKL